MQRAWGPVSVHRAAQRAQSIRHGPRLPGIHGEIVTPALPLQKLSLGSPRQSPRPGAGLLSVASPEHFRLVLKS